MLRWTTAGESHGEALVGILTGVPAGVEVSTDTIRTALARRRLGLGRGARMAFEADEVRLLGGVRHGATMGGPVAVEIANTEWPKWRRVMSPDPVPAEELTGARAEVLTRPRPGHADMTGMAKYGHTEARPVLERASARETAARVALGAVAAELLGQGLGVRLVSHVVAVGGAALPADAPRPGPEDVAALDDSPVRCLHNPSARAMAGEIEAAHREGDTLGGVVEVLAYGLPPGLGDFVDAADRLDARLAFSLMGIQAIKGVEIGDGFASARRRGSQAHDEIAVAPDGAWYRTTNRAGGIEGSMSNGETLRVRAAMKPISSVPRALGTVDVATGTAARAIHQRSDVCAVVPAAVVAEAMVALELARAALVKFGSDHLAELRRNVAGYLREITERGLRP